MRICMFSRIMPAHAAGGMQDHVQTLSIGLARKGHHVAVITTARADRKEFDIVDGVEIHFLKDTAVGRYSSAFWAASALKFEQLVSEKPFDILHSQSVGAYGAYKHDLHRKYHLPLITSFHGTHLDVITTSWHTDFSLTYPPGMARFFAVLLYNLYNYTVRDLGFTRGSDILIATSDADVWKYRTQYGVPETRVRKVYNGIDAQLFAPMQEQGVLQTLREQLRIRADEKIILALARLQKDKGVQNAIAVMPRVLARMSACLIVVGDGDYRAALEKLACKLGVADHVRFVGMQPLAECARYFNLCDVFVDPTLRTDGYDLTIAEAMACAKPVIVSDVGANSTLIDAATMGDGVLIPRGDNEALLREIFRVLNDPLLVMQMGERAREKIATRFSIEAMVQGMEKVYAEVTSGMIRNT